MGLVLDSSVLIADEKGHFDMDTFIEIEAPMDKIFITSISVSEILHGILRASPTKKLIREAYVEAEIKNAPVLSFDLACARHHAKLWATLAAAGKIIGSHDMLIAAICLRFEHRLATLNEKEFSRVKNLELANARPFYKKC